MHHSHYREMKLIFSRNSDFWENPYASAPFCTEHFGHSQLSGISDRLVQCKDKLYWVQLNIGFLQFQVGERITILDNT